jgi:hypothetical protein
MLCVQVITALLAAKQKQDPQSWQDFQERIHALKNQRTRARREAEDLQASIFAAETALRLQKEGALGTQQNSLSSVLLIHWMLALRSIP